MSVHPNRNRPEPGLNHGKVIKSDFRAPWWARNRHVQTIWPRLVQKRLPLSYRKQRLELPDGDFVDLAWGEQVDDPKGMVVLFHGLEGSIESHYANDLMANCIELGWLPVLMHFRGCGEGINKLPRAYHSGETSDPLYFLEWLDEQYPDLSKVAVGFSLGANMLLKLLGENPQQRFVKAAVAVSPPLQLNECAVSINKGFSRLYQQHLMKSMVATLGEKMSRMDYSSHVSLSSDNLVELKTFRDFDEHVTAPLHGFEGADDYYQRCSGMQFLQHITTPTLVLHAKDDPFMNNNVIPVAEQLSPMVRYELSDKGGHVGFMQGSPWRPKVWMHSRITDYICSFMQSGAKQEETSQ